MSRKRVLLYLSALGVFLILPRAVAALQESTATLESPGAQDSEETEGKGIIPPDSTVNASTMPVTPDSIFPQKSAYESAKAGLIHALDLWNNGHAEAASDAALEAYEDYEILHRVPGVKRSKLHAEMHQAAALYVEASIKTVKIYLKESGSSPETLEEARERLGDVKEVARDYHELTQMLNTALQEIEAPAPVDPQK